MHTSIIMDAWKTLTGLLTQTLFSHYFENCTLKMFWDNKIAVSFI